MSDCPKCGQSYQSKVRTKSSIQRLPIFGRLCLKVKSGVTRSSKASVSVYIHEE